MQGANIHSGKVLLVANPVAKNGAGVQAAEQAFRMLSEALTEDALEMVLTTGPGHARELVQEVPGAYDAIVALGGDGIIHDVANGLMALPAEARPVLGVLPVGSGNDYAKTLGMSEHLEHAVSQLLAAKTKGMDVGCVNGEHFVETFSCGIDAAIALDTVERRKTSKKTGMALYFEAGVNQFLHHFQSYNFSGVLDKNRAFSGKCLTMAIQIGPTYGGGFKICPNANPSDGVFDICYSVPTNKLHALAVFGQARNGHHVNSTFVNFEKASSIHLEFTTHPPTQADGEEILGTVYDISIANQAISVLQPA